MYKQLPSPLTVNATGLPAKYLQSMSSGITPVLKSSFDHFDRSTHDFHLLMPRKYLNIQLISLQMFRRHFVINYGKISEYLWTPHRLEKYSWRKNARGLLSCVLLTDRIEIHQSQPARSEGHTSGCDWWISIRSVDNKED